MTIQKVTQNINKMKKVRLKETYISMTVGKVYEVIEEDETHYTVIDDDGDKIFLYKHRFEEVEGPNYVMVRDSEQELWKKRILLHDLGEQFSYRYVVVGFGDDDTFINGEDNMSYTSYRQMKPINEVEQKIEELEQKLAELKEQINK